MRTIDLRSDTVTRPDAEMRRAMAEAEVGDDVFREDPTVRRLEEAAAALLGTEAALFVPSGTMGNQIALRVHAAPGTEVIAASDAHVFRYEMGAMAALSGLMPRPVEAVGGLLDPEAVEKAVAPMVDYCSRTGVVAVENTHNLAGGVVSTPARLGALVAVARRHGLPIHLDGARVLNAAVALGCPVTDLTRGFDSVMLCLSKGLGAPVGSLLCGSAAFVEEARRVRRLFGGGMRQVGVLAAAGLVALADGPRHLARDHENARRLASGLGELPGLSPVPERPDTNIVFVEVEGSAPALAAALERDGVRVIPLRPTALRFVTHRDVTPEDIEVVIERTARALRA